MADSPKKQTTYLRVIMDVAILVKSAIGRCFNCIAMFVFLTITLYCLRSEIHTNLFHRWSSSFFFSMKKHQYVALSTLHGPHSWVEAFCASVLATVGHNSSNKYSWLMMMPWLIRVALYWCKRTLAFGEMSVNVGEAENAKELLCFMLFINLMHLMVLIEVALNTWWKFRKMLMMDRQINEMRRFKVELGELMGSSPIFDNLL